MMPILFEILAFLVVAIYILYLVRVYRIRQINRKTTFGKIRSSLNDIADRYLENDNEG